MELAVCTLRPCIQISIAAPLRKPLDAAVGWRVWAKNAAVGAPSESVEQGAASTVWTAIAEKRDHKSKRHRTKGLLTYEGKLKKVLSKQTTVKTGGSHRLERDNPGRELAPKGW